VTTRSDRGPVPASTYIPDRPPDRLRRLPSWLLIRLYGPANRLVAAAMGRPGARADYAVLATVDQFGALSQAELGRRLDVDRSDMVALINRLVEDGLVLREPDPTDRRRNMITITEPGRRRLGQLDVAARRAQDELLAPLSAARRADLLSALQELVDHHRDPGL
jgi:MarR family transcriptional regulator, lower aerobic nicotinate degradation pathway regulator